MNLTVSFSSGAFCPSCINKSCTHELSPRSDHHQVVQKTRAHFLFLHFHQTPSVTASGIGVPSSIVVFHSFGSGVQVKFCFDDHCDGSETIHLKEQTKMEN